MDQGLARRKIIKSYERRDASVKPQLSHRMQNVGRHGTKRGCGFLDFLYFSSTSLFSFFFSWIPTSTWLVAPENLLRRHEITALIGGGEGRIGNRMKWDGEEAVN